MAQPGTGPYRTSHLPPMPDHASGLPRPPHAPLWPGWQPGDADRDPKRQPKAPPDQSPLLEYYKESHGQAWLAGSLAVGIVFIVAVLDGGFAWMTDWFMWALVLWPLPVFLLLRKVDIIAAGADWLLWKKKWVRTYDLAKVKLSPRGAQFNLILTDREGRKLSIPWLQLCYNRELWDLVYNGILHSAHNGPFVSNREARSTLRLPR